MEEILFQCLNYFFRAQGEHHLGLVFQRVVSTAWYRVSWATMMELERLVLAQRQWVLVQCCVPPKAEHRVPIFRRTKLVVFACAAENNFVSQWELMRLVELRE